MPFGLEQLTDGQRKALMFGVPAVALFALAMRFTHRNDPAPTPEDTTSSPTATATGIIPPASTDVLGVGQLAEFESQLTASINALANQLHSQPETSPAPPAAQAATPPPPIHPTWAPTPVWTSCPADHPHQAVDNNQKRWSCMNDADWNAMLDYLQKSGAFG